MTTQELGTKCAQLVHGRYIATLATKHSNASIHLTGVWHILEEGRWFVAISSRSRKARNVAARTKASLMVDARTPGGERGVTTTGAIELISGDQSREIDPRSHCRYLGAAAVAHAHIRPVFESLDAVTLRLTPSSWIASDMAAPDAQAFGGRVSERPNAATSGRAFRACSVGSRMEDAPANYLKMPKRQQVIALFALRWTFRRIERYAGVRRERSRGMPERSIQMRPKRSPARAPIQVLISRV
jgi:hypothetical protein